MPVLDGIEATRQIVAARPGVHVVVLTSFDDQRRILDALGAGATGYLLKDAEPDEVLAAIRTAVEGGSPLDPRAARVLVDARRGGGPARHSAREEEVLRLLADGLANKQIARRLGITERTVKAHLTSVFQQLGVTDRTQAALWAREHLTDLRRRATAPTTSHRQACRRRVCYGPTGTMLPARRARFSSPMGHPIPRGGYGRDHRHRSGPGFPHPGPTVATASVTNVGPRPRPRVTTVSSVEHFPQVERPSRGTPRAD